MARLTNTLINGSLKVTDNIYANVVHATTFSGKATSAGSADNATNASKVSINSIGTSSVDYGILVHNATGAQTPIKSGITINPGSKTIKATGYSFDGTVDVTKNNNFGTNTTSNITIGKSGLTTTINGSDVTIAGNLTVQGSTTISNITNLSVKNQLIELATGRANTSTPITNYAGMFIQKYDGTNSGALVFDSSGTAYVGDVTYVSSTGTIIPKTGTESSETSLQPLATRSKNLTADCILKWDNTNKTLVAASNLTDNSYAAANHNHNSTYITAVSVSSNKITYTLNGASKDAGTVDNVANATNATNATNVTLTATASTDATNGDKITVKAGNKTGATFTLVNAKHAATASKLSNTTAIGSSTVPVYFSTNGVPVSCSTTLGVSITGNAATATNATTASNVSTSSVSTGTNNVYFSNGSNKVGYSANFTYAPATSILTVNGITINGSTKVITATTFSGKATSAGSADTATTATKATNIAVDANNSSTLNVALLNVSAATTSTKPLVATTNKLSYNTSTGNLSALQLGIKSAGSDTTPKAYMKYNSTDECIEFIFA